MQAREFLAPLPVALLRARPALADLPEALERLGVRTLGELAALPPAALADRFGTAGLLAHELASGGDGALRPRPASEFLRESLELPEAASGMPARAGAGAADRPPAGPAGAAGADAARGGPLGGAGRAGGTWREQVVFREALADSVRMRLALAPRLALMPAPAEELRLAVERFGPPASDQRSLLDDPAAGAGGAAARGDPPGSGRRRSRRGAARARGRPRLALPRAPRRAGAVRGVRRDDRSPPSRGPHAASPSAPARTGARSIVDGRDVDAVRESWLIEDRWWTERPLRRRYWEVVTTCGRNEVVFHDLVSGRWWRQR